MNLHELSLYDNNLWGDLSAAVRWELLVNLRYLYLQQNSFTGSLPSSWESPFLIRIDASNNRLTGSLSSNVAAYPVSLNSLNVAFNSLSGIIPPAVAMYGNISYLNFSSNEIVFGSIPSEFCLSPGVNIDVSGTAIDCYSGCLTSSHVLVTGASAECHDGSIMYQFILISSVCAGAAALCTALYHCYGWWSPALVSLEARGQTTGSRVLSAMGGAAWWTRRGGVDAADSNVDHRPGSAIIFTILLGKCVLGVVISLVLNDWWTYGGGPDVPGNDISLTSCSDPTVGNCFAFCGDVHIIPVNITDDDVVTDYVDGQSDPQTYEHTQSSSYCAATFPGYCGYQYWFDFKLFPILLQLLQLLLQMVLWRFGSGDFTCTP